MKNWRIYIIHLFRENSQTTRKMKLTCLFSVLLYLTGFGSILSQSTKLTLHLKDVPVNNFIQIIEDQTDFYFIYQDNIFSEDQRVTIIVKEATLESIIQKMAEQTSVDFKIYDRQVVLVQKPAPPPSPPSLPLIFLPLRSQTGTGSIQGTITDEKGFPMIGATVVVDQTTIGTIADANGHYQLLAVPAGKRIIKYSFVGYNTEIREVELERGDVIEIDVKMAMSQIELLEVVAYGQARGQQAAINQQLRAPGIVNVISAEKLQELPDVNVAEAIGRLPGLMVERNRGEGQKIIIRGLEPKYNAISIGGNIVPSTSTDDRSTDLNMISPDILGGVEVQKANTADKDASGLGGTVDMILKEAPEGLKMNARILTGYSGHSESLSNYQGNFYMSNRFFNNKLGIMLTGNAEIAERNSDRFKVIYAVQGDPDYENGETYVKPWITYEELQANIEDRTRIGGSVLLDWKIGTSSVIKSSNFIGYLNRQIFDRSKQYSLSDLRINIFQYHQNINQLLYTNSLQGEHIIFNSVLDWGGSRSQSINKKPYDHRILFRQLSTFVGYVQGGSFDMEPPELLPRPENLHDFIDQNYFHNGRFSTYEALETESSMFVNCQIPFRIGNFFSGYVKTGTKYRVKDRSRINVLYHATFGNATSVNEFLQVYPDFILTTEGSNAGNISILNFLDQDYKAKDFLNDEYEYLKVNEVLDPQIISDIYDNYLKDKYDFIASAAKDDYNTYESILSYYIMSEINFGKYVTIIPGIRYEKTSIEYRAYVAEEYPASESTPIDVEFRDTTSANNYQHYLPQIHLKIKPTDWFDIRLAYTNTLSRPDYNMLAPKKIINISSAVINLGSTKLDPALSTNYDAILTFYKPKLGLLTLGAFYKNIQGFLWNRSALVVAGTRTDPDILNIPKSTLGFTVNYPLNNSNQSTIKGFECDIQSNSNFLPVKGFIINLNFTLMNSETKYNETLVIRKLNPDYGKIPGVPRIIFVNQDTAYTDRLLKQPSYLANIGLGYDNKKIGLSVRLSFNFQDEILIKEQRRPDGADREGTLEFYRWDFQIDQRISKKLSFNGNIANIFNQPDRSVRLITGYLTDIEYYGYLAQIGLKYNFF